MQDERRIDIRTLTIASIASAAAALVTSQFWIRGTPIAAALTPVIVTLVSELLHRPTDKLAQRMTAETDALPEAAGALPPPPGEAISPQPARDPDIRVYRSGGRKRRIAWTVVLSTGLLAFAIAAVVLTVPELIAGSSLGKGDRKTTLVPVHRDSKDRNESSPEQQTVTETVETTPETPAPTTTEPPPEPEQTTPSSREPPPTTPTTPPTVRTTPAVP